MIKRRIFQNGITTNIDKQDEMLKDSFVPKHMQELIYIGRCNNDYNTLCHAPGGMFTDLNIWSKDLGKDDMEKWTSCE